jgi:hypothetical protein
VDIAIDRAKAGMSLNRDVIDRQGQVLVRSGVTLTERSLSLIRARGIQRIDVAERIPANGPGAGKPASSVRLFRNQDLQHPLVQELMRVYRMRTAHVTDTAP